MAKNDKIKDDKTDQGDPQHVQDNAQMQQRQLRFVEEGVKTQYAGIFNVVFDKEAVVFIFGNPSVESNVVRIESKMAVSIKTAKRIALSLGNFIRKYETVNGMIDISTPKNASQSVPEEEKSKLQ